MKELIQKRLIFKKNLAKRKKIFAGWTSLSHPSISEIFSKSGVDFVGIDIEHSTINNAEAQRIIAACQAGGTLCLPRVATHSMEAAKRLLDSGADGLIFPNVSTSQQVEKIVSWCKYPPLGQRGFGVARAQGYGFHFDEYISKWNASSSIIVQIESIEAVENIEDIIRHKKIDGVMVGPYDISGSLGIPGKINHKRVIGATKRVIKACLRRGIACGTQVIEPDRENVRKQFSLGYTFCVLSSDVFLLWKWSENMKKLINNVKKR